MAQPRDFERCARRGLPGRPDHQHLRGRAGRRRRSRPARQRRRRERHRANRRWYLPDRLQHTGAPLRRPAREARGGVGCRCEGVAQCPQCRIRPANRADGGWFQAVGAARGPARLHLAQSGGVDEAAGRRRHRQLEDAGHRLPGGAGPKGWPSSSSQTSARWGSTSKSM